MTYQLLYKDDDLLGLNKPTGLLAVPGVGPDKRDCLSARVQVDFPEATVLHRLDRDTSGVMVLARTPEAHRLLSRQFELRRTEKIYHAMVAGSPADEAGVIDMPIHRDWTTCRKVTSRVARPRRRRGCRRSDRHRHERRYGFSRGL